MRAAVLLAWLLLTPAAAPEPAGLRTVAVLAPVLAVALPPALLARADQIID